MLFAGELTEALDIFDLLLHVTPRLLLLLLVAGLLLIFRARPQDRIDPVRNVGGPGRGLASARVLEPVVFDQGL